MASVQSYVTPDFLYRFRNVGHPPDNEKLDRELKTLVEGYLWGAPFNEMNDPMEGFFAIESMQREPVEIRQAAEKIRDNKLEVGLSCFNERADNELMWAHYANQFHGICVAYDFVALMNGLPDDVAFTRVAYSEDIPQAPVWGMMPVPERAVLSTKNHRWAYEREWRMFGRLGRNDFAPGTWQIVPKVYVGNRVDAERFAAIREALVPRGIVVEQINVKGYTIELNPPMRMLRKTTNTNE